MNGEGRGKLLTVRTVTVFELNCRINYKLIVILINRVQSIELYGIQHHFSKCLWMCCAYIYCIDAEERQTQASCDLKVLYSLLFRSSLLTPCGHMECNPCPAGKGDLIRQTH